MSTAQDDRCTTDRDVTSAAGTEPVLEAAFPTIPAADEPTDPLARASLEALAAYRDARTKANAADDAFRASVHPKVWEAHKEIDELDQVARDATGDMWIAELCRHFPGFAPALRVTWEHIIDTSLLDVGACCTAVAPEPSQRP